MTPEEKKAKGKELLKSLPSIGRTLTSLRTASATGPGADISLDKYLKENLGISQSDFLQGIGVNTKVETINNLFGYPGTEYRWVVPEILREAILTGIRQAPIYPNLIVSDQPVSQLQVTMPYVNMSDANPAKINEAETIPLGTISYGQKQVSIFKIGKGIKISDEVKNYVSLDVVGIFFRDHGIKMGYAMDSLAFDTIINGDLINGTESAPVVGVGDNTQGIAYRDLLRIWVRGARLGRNFTTMVGGEDMTLDLLDLPEFKDRQAGTTQATLTVKSPVPRNADIYVHGAIPDTSLLLIDTSAALIKLTAQPLLLESERIVSNQTEGYYSTITTGFAKMYKDASLLVDSTVDFANSGFPSFMDIDPLTLVNLE